MPPKRRPGSSPGSSLGSPAAPGVAAATTLQRAAKAATPWSGAFTPVKRQVEFAAPSPSRAADAASPVFSVDSRASPTGSASSSPKDAAADKKEQVEWSDALLAERPGAVAASNAGSGSVWRAVPAAVNSSATEEEVLLLAEQPDDTGEEEPNTPGAGSGAQLRQRALGLRAKRLPAVPYISIHADGGDASGDASSALDTSCASAVDLIYSTAAEVAALEPPPWRFDRTRSAGRVARTASESSSASFGPRPRVTTSAPQPSRAPLRGAERGGVVRVVNAARLVARAKQLQETRSSSASPQLRASPPPTSPVATHSAHALAAVPLSFRAKGLSSAKLGSSSTPPAAGPAAAAGRQPKAVADLSARVKKLQEARSSSRAAASPRSTAGVSGKDVKDWD